MKQIMQKKNLFQLTQDLFFKLSKEDQLKVSPSGNFVDSPALVGRICSFDPHGRMTGFTEAYRYNGNSNNVAFIVIAVLPEWRKQGIGSNLLEQIVDDAFSKGFNKIIYRTSTSNKESQALAKSNGFKKVNQSKTFVVFSKSR